MKLDPLKSLIAHSKSCVPAPFHQTPPELATPYKGHSSAPHLSTDAVSSVQKVWVLTKLEATVSKHIYIYVNMGRVHPGFNKNVLSRFKWFWFYSFCAGKSDVSGYKRNAWYNLSVTNLLPSKHQWKTVRETYGVTNYGSGWRKDVVNQCLEVAVTAKSGVAYWRCIAASPASQNWHLITSGQNDPWCSRLTDLLQRYQRKSNWLGMYGDAWCHHRVRHHEMWLAWILSNKQWFQSHRTTAVIGLQKWQQLNLFAAFQLKLKWKSTS